MLNLYPRLQLQLQASTIDDGGDDEHNVDAADGYSACYGYGIAAVCVTIFVFCVLVSTVSAWKACAFAALAAALFGAAGCFAPRRWFRRRQRGVGAAELVVVTVTAGAARPGYPCAQVKDAPPAFAIQSPAVEVGGAGGGEAASCVVVCSVCLEDVRGGEMVRQVPACGHVFHVPCFDMWLHSHRTCPMCRCVVSPVAEVTTPKDAASEAEAAPELLSDDHELPPV